MQRFFLPTTIPPSHWRTPLCSDVLVHFPGRSRVEDARRTRTSRANGPAAVTGSSNRCGRAATRIAQFRAGGFCVRLTQLDASRWVAKTSSAGPASELAASPADPLNATHQNTRGPTRARKRPVISPSRDRPDASDRSKSGRLDYADRMAEARRRLLHSICRS